MTFDQWQEAPNAQELARFMLGKVTCLDAAYISMLIRSAYDAGKQEGMVTANQNGPNGVWLGELTGVEINGVTYNITGVRT